MSELNTCIGSQKICRRQDKSVCTLVNIAVQLAPLFALQTGYSTNSMRYHTVGIAQATINNRQLTFRGHVHEIPIELDLHDKLL